MERKRVAGRFVREEPDGGDGGVTLKAEVPRAPRPKYCRSYTRKRVAEALPEITTRFVAEAKKGSIQHAKVLMKLGGLDGREVPKPAKRRGKSVVGRLLEQFRKDPALREAGLNGPGLKEAGLKEPKG